MPIRSFIVVVVLAIASAPVEAAEGVQVTPDGKASLISKDVGGERWAIHFSTASDTPLVVTGNVFRGADSEPAFLYCTPLSADGDVNDIENVLFTFSCFGADRCTATVGSGQRCEPFNFIRDVQLRGSFFLPP